MVVGDSEYTMIAQDKVGCLTADGNVDDVDLHRAHGPSCAAAYARGGWWGCQNTPHQLATPVTRAAEV